MQTATHPVDSFSETIYNRANDYFDRKPTGKFASSAFYIKAVLFLLAYGTAYIYFVFFTFSPGQLFLLAFVLGLLHVLIPVSMSHDAIHRSISSKKWINDMGLLGFEITGSNSYMYSIKHLEAHINKENGNKTLAIESQGLLIQKQKNNKSVNMPVYFYLFYSQYMIFLRDFILYFSDPAIPRKQFIKLLIAKTVYITTFIILPFVFIPFPWWQVLCALLFMYLAVTAFLVIILLMPTEKMEHTRLKEGKARDDRWLVEILEHNVDFSPGSVFLNLLAGGANLNVVHYVFPSVNHVHYNKLAAIIESTATEFGYHYRKQQVRDVFGIHFNYLKNIQESKG